MAREEREEEEEAAVAGPEGDQGGRALSPSMGPRSLNPDRPMRGAGA